MSYRHILNEILNIDQSIHTYAAKEKNQFNSKQFTRIAYNK